MQPSTRLERFLSSPRVPAMVAALGALATAPAIATGLQLDDLLHRAALDRIEPYATWVSSPWKLFTFFDGTPAHNAWLRDVSFLPWFADPQLKVAFFRPVSIATHLLDHRLFPGAPWAMHVHSIAWYAALVAMVAVFYRRVIATRWVAGLAAVLYAVDDAHAVPASWIANRNATIASAFAVLTLILHDRAVRDRSRAALVLAPLALALALGAGETGVATMAWLLSYALFLDPDPWKKRLLRVTPYGFVFAIWAVAWRASGAGSNGSAIYNDPISHPLRFLRVLPERFLVLILGALTNAPTDLSPFVRWLMLVMAGLGLVVLVLAVKAFAPLVRARPTSRFFAFGAALSLVPVCGVVPSNRLLMLAGIGVFGLVAEQVEVAREGFARGFARFSLFMHAGLAPLSLLVMTHQFAITGALGSKFNREIPTDPSIAGRDLVALNAAEPGMLPYLAVGRALRGVPAPRRSWMLSISWQPLDVTRVGERALKLVPRDGFLADPLSGLVKDPRDPIPLFVPIACGPMTVTVTRAMPDGRPAEAIFEFDRSLDDPTLFFVKFDGDAFRATSLPKIGETMTLPGTPLF
ncbi:MAG: hypothetical protein ACXVEF_02955 [Polyangiales bacterium]